MQNIISVDPGKSGAIAHLQLSDSRVSIVDVWDTPMLAKEYNIARMIDLIKSAKATFAIIENVTVRPGEGVVSCFSMGYGCGVYHTIFAGLKLPYEVITPAQWCSVLKLPKRDTTAQRKADHVALASKLHPNHAQLFVGARGGLIDGRADAVLIAEGWVRRNLQQQKASA